MEKTYNYRKICRYIDNNENVTMSDLMKKFDIPYSNLYQYIKKNDLAVEFKDMSETSVDYTKIKKYIDKREGKISLQKVADKFGVRYGTLYQYAKKNNWHIEFRDMSETSVDYTKIKKYIDKRNGEVSLQKVADKFGVAYGTLYQYAKKHEWNIKFRDMSETIYPYKKVKKYIDKKNGDVTIADLSKRYDIPYGALYNYVKKHNWL